MTLKKKKKNAWPESCESNFIWGKVRTAVQETVPQVSLRNCSKERGGVGEGDKEVSVIWAKGRYEQSSTYFSNMWFLLGFCWSCEAFASHEEQSPP